MRNVIHVNPRARPPALEKCPQCGKPDLEIRTDGAYLCKHCFYTTKSRIDGSLLQQWTHSIFNLEDETPPPEERIRGGRMAGVAGITVVAVLGLICLLAGYTMSRGDPKAWRAILPVGLIGLILGIVGPGGALGVLGGAIAAFGGYIGRDI